MKVHEIPQDNIRTLAGEKKLLHSHPCPSNPSFSSDSLW